MNTLLELDCRDGSSALTTTAAVLGYSADELRARLTAFDTEEPPELSIWPKAMKYYEPPTVTPHRIRWYHASRVPRSMDFSLGLLPTPEAKPLVNQLLKDLAVAQGLCETGGWDLLPKGGPGVGCQAAKAQVGLDEEGPFGFLLRSAALGGDGEDPSHFLHAPELVVDICHAFTEPFGTKLLGVYRQASEPVLVEFWTPGPIDDALTAALCYAWAHVKDQPPSPVCEHTFSGQGQRIPANRIAAVNFDLGLEDSG